ALGAHSVDVNHVGTALDQKAVIKDSVAGADGGFAVSERIPGEADSRHELFVVDRRDSGGYAFIARGQQTRGRVRGDGRLLTRHESVHSVADFGIGRVDFVAKSVIQSEVFPHAPFILRVEATVPFAESAIELAASLEKLHRLSCHETAEGIAQRKRCED